MVGAFTAGGVVVGLGPAYVRNTLHGGNAGWGVVFSAIFFGLAAGMFLGMRIMRGFSRRRLFGVAITCAAVPLALIGLIRTWSSRSSWSSCSAPARASPT